jgi:hypothetical protein
VHYFPDALGPFANPGKNANSLFENLSYHLDLLCFLLQVGLANAKSIDPQRASAVLLAQPFEEIPKVWPHPDKYAVELDIFGGRLMTPCVRHTLIFRIH